MRNLLLTLLASSAFAAGPQYKHQDRFVEAEFQNVYLDIANAGGGETVTIDPLVSSSATITHVTITTATIHNIVAPTSGASVTVGGLFEYKEATASGAGMPATNTYGDLASLSLGAGTWIVFVSAEHAVGSATMTRFSIGASITSGNSTTGLSDGQTRLTMTWTPANTITASPMSLATRFSFNSTTTVYLKYSATYSAGSPNASGKIAALRIY